METPGDQIEQAKSGDENDDEEHLFAIEADSRSFLEILKEGPSGNLKELIIPGYMDVPEDDRDPRLSQLSDAAIIHAVKTVPGPPPCFRRITGCLICSKDLTVEDFAPMKREFDQMSRDNWMQKPGLRVFRRRHAKEKYRKGKNRSNQEEEVAEDQGDEMEIGDDEQEEEDIVLEDDDPNDDDDDDDADYVDDEDDPGFGKKDIAAPKVPARGMRVSFDDEEYDPGVEFVDQRSGDGLNVTYRKKLKKYKQRQRATQMTVRQKKYLISKFWDSDGNSLSLCSHHLSQVFGLTLFQVRFQRRKTADYFDGQVKASHVAAHANQGRTPKINMDVDRPLLVAFLDQWIDDNSDPVVQDNGKTVLQLRFTSFRKALIEFNKAAAQKHKETPLFDVEKATVKKANVSWYRFKHDIKRRNLVCTSTGRNEEEPIARTKSKRKRKRTRKAMEIDLGDDEDEY